LKAADSNFRGFVTLTIGSGHTAYHRVSLVKLYPHVKFHWNRRNFLWTDGRTYARKYIYADKDFRPALLGRLCRRVDLTTVNHFLQQIHVTHRKKHTLTITSTTLSNPLIRILSV